MTGLRAELALLAGSGSLRVVKSTDGGWRLATRKSRLALAQTAQARQALESAHAGARVETLPMTTTGDERLGWSLEVKGGKGLFTSELERAILAGEADYAVHSAKDLPTEMDPGLEIIGYLPREDARDVLILREGVETPRTLASGSPRRREQVARLFPQAEWTGIRGNVETRLRKLSEGLADGGVMAAAGLRRLGIESWPGLVFRPLEAAQCVPAAGQGAIAVQGRHGEDEAWKGLLCERTRLAVSVERAALSAMGGGCHSSSAAFWDAGVLHLFDSSFGRRTVPLENPDPAAVRNLLKHLLESDEHE